MPHPSANMVPWICGVVAGLVLASPVISQDAPPAAATYQNPLDVVGADPFVYREGDTYYLYATAAEDGLLVWTSKDLVHWQKRGHAFKRDAATWSQDRFWAPELLKHRGKYYLYFTAAHSRDWERDTPRIVLAEGDSPLGPFREVPGKAPWFATEKPTIDGHVFRDRDGQLYLYVVHLDEPPDKHFEIRVRKVGEDLTVSAESAEVLRATQPWELIPHPAPNDALVAEAPFVVRRGETLFMTWSANPQGTRDYAVGVATASSPAGPWKKSELNPILRKTDKLWAPGHQCLIDSPDGRQWFMMYPVREPKDFEGERRLAIDRVQFVDGEAPTIKALGPTDTPQPLPLAPRRAGD